MNLSRHFLIFLTLRFVSVTLSEKTSGFYIDNGHDQTALHEVLSQKQKFELEEEMLSLLDIPEKPQHVSRNLDLVKRSAPMFLIDVYNFRDDADAEDEALEVSTLNDTNLSVFDIRGQNVQNIKDSNFIMSLGAQSSKFPGVVKTEKVKRLWFNVSHVSSEDEILRAELRLFRSIENVSVRRNQGPITIIVYRVASARNEDGDREFVFVDSINTTEINGWVILNITESLHHWVYSSEPNRGLYLSAFSNDRPDHEIRPENVGIVGFGDDPAKQPFMVGYLKRTELRRKRRIELSYADSYSFFEDLRFQRKPTPCQRENLYVNFADLNWQDIIIAPKGYDAYFCYGECNFPFQNEIRATNHAVIQGLVNLRNSSIPKPCCAPIEMKKIKLIYQLDEDSYAYRDKDNMVVGSCGCQ
ncbi:protein 60A-like [Belonocnema kinseyi]|uniref:protein 60A-like n=1 Tax=Belonocnema kinseyi TaxID=2817044 RepID=UPI00143DB81B|nr:protein 60A-like [Belonocnema kinseyi]